MIAQFALSIKTSNPLLHSRFCWNPGGRDATDSKLPPPKRLVLPTLITFGIWQLYQQMFRRFTLPQPVVAAQCLLQVLS
jgi:hypothetical protein